MVSYSYCPVCKSNVIHAALNAIDHTVTKERFSVWKCDVCTVLFTQDAPAQPEIGRYYQSDKYISHSDTSNGFINRLYHRIRTITLHQKKKKMIKNTTGLQSGTILDIGCGTGAFLHTMKQAGWNITGLEPDETARKNALSLYNIDPLPPGELFNLPKDSFDVITAWHVMEHVHQLHEYIDSLKRILAPGGKIFIAVPNHTSYDALGYKSFWAAWDVPRHLYHFSPQSMHILMQIHGLTIQEISPMWFDSFYVCMLSEQYKNGKGNIIRAFYNGMISNMKALPDKQNCSSLIYVISNKEVK